MEEEITVQLELPRSAYEFCCFMAKQGGISTEDYLISGIKDLIIGGLVYFVDLPEEDGSNTKVMDEYLAAHGGEPLSELSTAPRIAEKLAMRDFLVQPHHSDGWDFNALDIPI